MTQQRQKTATFRFDPETHSLLDELAREYGQNKTQVLKRMIREETARKDLNRRGDDLNEISAHEMDNSTPLESSQETNQ
jgi:predicted transcriptional regulator